MPGRRSGMLNCISGGCRVMPEVSSARSRRRKVVEEEEGRGEEVLTR